MDYSKYPKRSILCIDMKSFYASAAAVMEGLDPLSCYLAVVGNKDRSGSVVLAASPALKKDYKIKTGSRLFEIPDDQGIHIVDPKMTIFIRLSIEIMRLFYQYVPPAAVHAYSVDESFLDVRGLGKVWGDPETIALLIQSNIKRNFGLPCTIGIGPNMLMAKLALDLESKQAPNGIASWTYEDIPSKLWPVRPLSSMWGVGRRLEKTLNSIGIFTVGQLAKYDLGKLEKKFGIIGNQLYYHAWGIDLSDIGAPIMQGQASVGKSQILLRDYPDPSEVKQVLLEICEEVARRARSSRKAGRTVSLGIGYSKDEFGGGFLRSKTIEQPTNITMEIYRVCLALFDQFYASKTVRKISVTLANLEEDDARQLTLFHQDAEKKHALGYAMDAIRAKHGSKAILRGISYTPAGTALHRAKLVGGHKS